MFSCVDIFVGRLITGYHYHYHNHNHNLVRWTCLSSRHINRSKGNASSLICGSGKWPAGSTSPTINDEARFGLRGGILNENVPC